MFTYDSTVPRYPSTNFATTEQAEEICTRILLLAVLYCIVPHMFYEYLHSHLYSLSNSFAVHSCRWRTKNVILVY